MIRVLHKNKGRAEHGNYHGVSPVVHAGKLLLKIVASRLGDYSKVNGVLPEKKYGFRPRHLTLNMMFEERRLKELRRKTRVQLFLCFIDPQKAYYSVDRSLLREVLPRFIVPQWMIATIRQFNGGMGSCVRNDNVFVRWGST